MSPSQCLQLSALSFFVSLSSQCWYYPQAFESYEDKGRSSLVEGTLATGNASTGEERLGATTATAAREWYGEYV